MSGAAAPRRRSGGKDRTRLRHVGIALAGGGPLGGICEIGALLALFDSLDDLPLHTFDHLEAWLAAAFAT
jgi:hypothetical protein